MVKAIRPSSLLCHGNLKVDVSWRKLKDVHVFLGVGTSEAQWINGFRGTVALFGRYTTVRNK